MNFQEMTTKELEKFIQDHFDEHGFKDLDDSEVDLFLAAIDEHENRCRSAHPEEAAARDARVRAWIQLLMGTISPTEYQNNVLSTALSEGEQWTLLGRIRRNIRRAEQFQKTFIRE